MAQNISDSEITYGFLGVFDGAADNAMRGAAMVTNVRGFPLEFRVTTPVRPTAVQTALYGESLEPYVTNELLGSRLAVSLKSSPTVLLVNRLSGLDTDIDKPLGFVSHTDDYVHTEASDIAYTVLQPPSGLNQAIAIVSKSPTDHDELGIHLIEAFRYFDLVEAFSRMNTALNVLAESDERYR